MENKHFNWIMSFIENSTKEELWSLIISRALWEYCDKHGYNFNQTDKLIKGVLDKY